MGMDILMSLFGNYVQGVLEALVGKKSPRIAVPHCPRCGNRQLQRWTPFVIKLAFVLGVTVAYLALALGFWWVVLFVGATVTGNLTVAPTNKIGRAHV